MIDLIIRTLQVFASSDADSSHRNLLLDWEVAQILGMPEDEVSQILREMALLGYLTQWFDKQGSPFSLSEKGQKAIDNRCDTTFDMNVHSFSKIGFIKCNIEFITPIEKHLQIEGLREVLRKYLLST